MTTTTKCPGCDGPLLDLRGTGFSPAAMENEGTCVLHSASPWGVGDAFWCAHHACGNHPIQYECKVPGQTQPVMVEPPWDGKYRARYS